MMESGWNSMRTAVVVAALIAGLGGLNAAHAEPVIEEVVVTGIRQALEESLNTKRQAAGFVDAVSAEDIGKLPDQNVAEALQRVPGVAIQRNRGEGDFVSIRGLGPEFVRATLNGRTLVSGTEANSFTRNGNEETSNGRETNFDLLPSELISVLEVVKSPAAQHVEGGMGGVVNVKTRRPLDIGPRNAFSVSGVYRDLNDKFDPNVSGLYSWTNSERQTGFLLSFAYSDRSVREDNADSWGYAPLNWWIASVDSDADGVADYDGGDLFTASASNPESYDEQRERTTVSGVLQHSFANDSELTVDFLYSLREIDNLGSIGFASAYGWTGVWPSLVGGAGEAVTNADGSVQMPDFQATDSTATGYSVRTGILAGSDQQDLEDELISFGLRYDIQVANWRHEIDAIYSRAEGSLSFQRSVWGSKERVPFAVSIDGGLINYAPLPGGPDLGDLSNWTTSNSDAIERYNDDEEMAFRVDSERGFDSGIAEAIKVGARFRSRNKEKQDSTRTGIPTSGVEAIDVGGARHIDGWLDGDGDFPFGNVPFPTVSTFRDHVSGLKDVNFVPPYSPERSYDIEESTYAVYAQLDLRSDIGDVPVSGNVGVRVVHTDSEITGFSQPFRIENDEMHPSVRNAGSRIALGDEIIEEVYSKKYTNVLPSLNLRFDLSDELLLRFAVAKAVTRPTFKDLSPGLVSINETNREATSGNPGLAAYEAVNYDLGLEWYFDESSVLYAAVFAKDIKNFVGNGTETDPNHRTPEADGDGDGIPDGLGSSVERFGVGFGAVTQPFNQGEAEIIGVEAGYQHAFANGFGYVVNATFIDSSAEFTSGANEGQSIPFEGVSDFAFNVTGYYENRGWQARLAYAYRDKYVLDPDGIWGFNRLYVEDYGQLDASLSYTFAGRFTVFLNGVNLTGEETRIYSTASERALSYSVVGRRYQVGVRGRF